MAWKSVLSFCCHSRKFVQKKSRGKGSHLHLGQALFLFKTPQDCFSPVCSPARNLQIRPQAHPVPASGSFVWAFRVNLLARAISKNCCKAELRAGTSTTGCSGWKSIMGSSIGGEKNMSKVRMTLRCALKCLPRKTGCGTPGTY